MATSSKGVVRAIIPSEFASEHPEYTNESRPFYWKEKTRKKKSGRPAVCSSDGRVYHVTKGTLLCHYRCRHRGICTGTLIVHPNGKVVNHVKHNCSPDLDVIRRGKEKLDECRSRQSEESGYSSSPSVPCSATLPGSPLLGQLLQPLSTGENTDNGIQSLIGINETTRPPRILRLLQEQEDQTVIIHCNLDRGHPTSTVTWYKEGSVINLDSDERITIVSNKHYEQLQIRDFQQSDEGMYQLYAFNDVGNDVGSIAYNGNSGSKPEFIRNPQDQRNVSPGFPVIFSAIADGDHVSFQWKHNGELLTDDDRISGSNDHQLNIFPAMLKDEGKYEVVASNEHGEVFSIPAFLIFRVEKSDEAQMAVSESSDPTLSFNSYMPDNQGTGVGFQTSTRCYTVPTRETDTGAALATQYNPHHNREVLNFSASNNQLLSMLKDEELIFFREKSDEARMAVSESGDPILSFNCYVTDMQSIEAGIHTSAQATDTDGSSELATGLLHVDNAMTTCKLVTEAIGTSEPTELVTGLMQRLSLPGTKRFNPCNSQNRAVEESEIMLLTNV